MVTKVPDLPIGAYNSIAGGTPLAVERALSTGCRVLQIFVKNNSRWIGKEIGTAEARGFRRAARLGGFAHVAAHTCYLINFASPFRALRRQSIAALADEIRRCEVNDSKKPRGSRVDRHEHIGRGAIGEAGFLNLMTDRRLAAIPKFLETPKDEALDFDRENLATLRRLAVCEQARSR